MNTLTVKICQWKACSDCCSKFLKKRLEADIDFYKYHPNALKIIESPCMNHCKNAVNIKINDTLFSHQNPASASKLVYNTLNSDL